MKLSKYQAEYKEQGVFGDPSIILYVDISKEIEEHQEQFLNCKRSRHHPEGALGWVRFFQYKDKPIFVIKEIQSDIMSKKGLCSSVYNRYKRWYRWLLAELIKFASAQGIKEIYVPTAIQIYFIWCVLPKLERGKIKRSHERVFGGDIEKRTEAWERIYNRNAEYFGGKLISTFDENGKYLRIDDTRTVLDYVFSIDVEYTIRKIRCQEQ